MGYYNNRSHISGIIISDLLYAVSSFSRRKHFTTFTDVIEYLITVSVILLLCIKFMGENRRFLIIEIVIEYIFVQYSAALILVNHISYKFGETSVLVQFFLHYISFYLFLAVFMLFIFICRQQATYFFSFLFRITFFKIKNV